MNRKMLYKRNKKFSIIFAILVILSVLPFPFLFSSNRKIAFGASVTFYSFFSIVLLIILVTTIYSLIMNTKSKNKAIIKTNTTVYILAIAGVSLIFYFCISSLPNYYKDIPKIITSEYPSIDGELTNLSIHKGRGASTNFIIDGIKFSIDGVPSSDFLVEGKKYHVCYLPNSKFVIKIERYNE